MEILTIAAVVFLTFALTCIIGVAILRKRPGLRRRRENPLYDGPPRRMTDCSHELKRAPHVDDHAFDDDLPSESLAEYEQRVNMAPSTQAKVSK